MATVKLPYELQGGQKAIASQVMANFEAVLSGFSSINKELENITGEVDGFNKKPTIAAFTIFPSLVGKAPVGAYPLWTGEQVINARTLFKDFWEKALEYAKAGYIRTLTQAEYDAEIEEYGQTGAFVIDELNGHIRLPKITRFISGLEDISKLGEPQKDGIPKLSGEFFIAGNAVQGADASGIFKKKVGRTCTGYGMGAASMPAIEVDISEQITITEEVQPRHVRVAWYIQVANNIADISTLDTAAITNLLNNALEEISVKKAEAEANYTTLTLEKTNEIGATVNNLILGIQGETSVLLKNVTNEGDKQVARVTAAGSNLVNTGTTQAGIVNAEGTKQVGLVQQAGSGLVESGNAQVGRVSAEGDTQVGRIVETVKNEVDAKLVIIQEAAQQIYDAGTSQLAAVNAAGATQTTNAKAQADRAYSEAERAKGLAESLNPERLAKNDLSNINTAGEDKISALATAKIKAYQPEISSLTQTSGTVALAANKIYAMTVSGATTFSLPAPSNRKVFNQIKIMLKVTGTPTISWGTSSFFNKTTPEIEAGSYDVYFDYDELHSCWVCGAMRKGAAS